MTVAEIKLHFQKLNEQKVELALTDDLKTNIKNSQVVYSKLGKAVSEMDALEQNIISKRKELKSLQSIGQKEYNSLLDVWDKINLNSKELGVDPYKQIIGFQDAKKLINFLKTNVDVVDEYMKPI